MEISAPPPNTPSNLYAEALAEEEAGIVAEEKGADFVTGFLSDAEKEKENSCPNLGPHKTTEPASTEAAPQKEEEALSDNGEETFSTSVMDRYRSSQHTTITHFHTTDKILHLIGSPSCERRPS